MNERSTAHHIHQCFSTRNGEGFYIHEDVSTEVPLFPDWKMGLGDLQASVLAFLPGIASQSEQQGRLFLLVDRLPELAQQLHLALSEVG